MGTKNNPGRSVTGHGYVLIRVGKRHHLADVRGYAYEHRLVMEEKLGRRLAAGELVHHLDGNQANNDPRNLAVETRASHLKHHDPRQFRRYSRSITCRKGHVKEYRRPNGYLECRVCMREADRKRTRRERAR